MESWSQAARRALRPRRRRDEALPILGGFGLGAGAMYFLDPDRGARRRALVHDRIVRSLHRTAELVEKASRDLDARAHGLAAEARSRMHHEPVSDDVLVARVRSRMGRAVQHPHAIEVRANGGQVTLAGPVLADDVAPLLARVEAVPGVRAVENQLEVHETPEGVPALQGGRRHNSQKPWVREQWSPIVRVAAAGLSAGLIARGVQKRSGSGRTLIGLGAALLIRDVANRSLRRLFGIGAGRHVVEVQKTLDVSAPPDQVFELLRDVEQLPRFMSHLIRVQPLGGGVYHWVAAGPLGIPVSWNAEITEVVPGRVLAWKSLPGAVIGNAGIIHFEPTPEGGTRLDIKVAYNPPGGILGHALAVIFGVDPKHTLDQDLIRFQSLVELGKTTAHGVEVRLLDLAGRPTQ